VDASYVLLISVSLDIFERVFRELQ